MDTTSISRLSLILIAALMVGCSNAPQSAGTPRPVGEAIRSCVEESGQKLDAALESGDVETTAREIVQILDDYEDAPEMAHFEEFHRQMEQLQGLAAKDSTNEDLAGKIAEIKALADKLVAEGGK